MGIRSEHDMTWRNTISRHRNVYDKANLENGDASPKSSFDDLQQEDKPQSMWRRVFSTSFGHAFSGAPSSGPVGFGA